jgi:hypothetical protein
MRHKGLELTAKLVTLDPVDHVSSVAGTNGDGASSVNVLETLIMLQIFKASLKICIRQPAPGTLARIFKSLSKPRAPRRVGRNNNKALLCE